MLGFQRLLFAFILALLFTGCCIRGAKRFKCSLICEEIVCPVIPVNKENPFSGKLQCGLNAIWKVANHDSISVTSRQLMNVRGGQLGSPIRDFEMVATLRDLGFETKSKSATFMDVYESLEKGNPVIVLVRRNLEHLLRKGDHWATVYGFESRSNTVFLDWGVDGVKNPVSLKHFQKIWSRCGSIAVFINTKQQRSRCRE